MTRTSWLLITIAGLLAFVMGGAVAFTEDIQGPQAKTSAGSQAATQNQIMSPTAAPMPITAVVGVDKKEGKKDHGAGHAYGHDRGEGHTKRHDQGKGHAYGHDYADHASTHPKEV